MEVDEKPTEKYTDVGGLDKQIEELVEAVVWPMQQAELFKKIGIKAPKGTFSSLQEHLTQLPPQYSLYLLPTSPSLSSPSLPHHAPAIH